MNLQLVFFLAIAVIIFHPFIFLWYAEVKKNKKLIALAQLALPAEKSVPAEEMERQLAAKDRELSAKELALNLARKRLDKLDAAKFEFVSVTTHQLRTPLAAIKWALHMLAAGQLGPISDEQKVFLQKSYESTDRAIEIVNELLKIDSIQEGKDSAKVYRFSATDLVALVENVISLFQNEMKEKQIKLSFQPPPAPLSAEIDPPRLRVALENLLSNAVKYTKPGGEVTIRLSDAKLNSARAAVELTIKDSGIGIPKAEQGKIFQRFFRSSNALKLETDGNGLGLAIAKDIVDNHQGEIWFESEENAGTTFHLTIPTEQIKVQ